MPVAASRVVHRAPARAWTRGSPNLRAGVLRPSAVRDGCAIRSKAGLARMVPWPARSASSMRWLAARALDWRASRLGRRALQPRSRGALMTASMRIAPAVFEVLLDPGVLVEQVQHDAAAVGADDRPVDRRAEHAGGVAADVAVEDDLHVGGAADVEVVS